MSHWEKIFVASSLFFIYLLGFCPISAEASGRVHYDNPLEAGADPYVLKHRGEYYRYFSMGDKVWVNKSHTLTDASLWNNAGATCVHTAVFDNRDNEESWNNAHLWAPEVHYINGRFYLYYCADNKYKPKHHLFVATADNPYGPFVDTGEALVTSPHGLLDGNNPAGSGLQDDAWAIDANVFVDNDQDSTIYITWSGPPHTCQCIRIAKMETPTKIDVNTIKTISLPERDWEKGDSSAEGLSSQPVNEGPFMFKKKNKYFIVYSASHSQTAHYCLGLLSTTNPLGEWVKEGPVFEKNTGEEMYGVGHNCLVKGMNGIDDVNCYHYKTGTAVTWDDRMLAMSAIEWDKGEPNFGEPYKQNQSLGKATRTDNFEEGRAYPADWEQVAPRLFKIENGQLIGDSRTVEGWQIGGMHDLQARDLLFEGNLKIIENGTASTYPKAGIYISDKEAKNFVALWMDSKHHCFALLVRERGVDRSWLNIWYPPADFDFNVYHAITITKNGQEVELKVDGNVRHSFSANFDEVQMYRSGVVLEACEAAVDGVLFTRLSR